MMPLLLVLNLVAPGLLGAAPPLPAVFSQADANPCENTDVVPATDTQRELTLEQFGVAVEIPENYRAILRNDGSVQVVDPGTYNLIRCEATGGNPLGRGYAELVIRGVAAPAEQALEATVRESVDADLPDTARAQPQRCISPYPLADQRGYLVQTPTRRHAEFWIEPNLGSDITVLETSCDCAGMVERLTNVLERTTLLTAAAAAGAS